LVGVCPISLVVFLPVAALHTVAFIAAIAGAAVAVFSVVVADIRRLLIGRLGKGNGM